MSGARVLWVDDDARGLLSGIASDVQRCGCSIETAVDFNGAMSHLTSARPQERAFASMLADVVLPRGRRNAGIARHLGIGLVGPAVLTGIKTIAFLTVVPLEEIGSRLEDLRCEHAGLRLEYFSKAHMLDRGALAELGEYLKVTCKKRAP
jgi:hypothetical protein